jgi:hypothetical protein
MARYSGTPLIRKLGIKPGFGILAIDPPPEYVALLGPLPEDSRILSRAPRDGADLIHLFVKLRTPLESGLQRARAAMRTDGALWVSWYKKAAKIPTDVTEDVIRALALKTDLVDVNVCAVSDIWSGLKLVVRKELR